MFEASRRIWWRSRAPVALYVEPAHPAHIAARSNVGADGVGVESGAHLPLGPCAPMVATTIRRCFLVLLGVATLRGSRSLACTLQIPVGLNEIFLTVIRIL